MAKFLRSGLIGTGIFFTLLTFAFASRVPWALSLFPFSTYRTSSMATLFIASVFAAAASVVWYLGAVDDIAPSLGGVYELTVTFTGIGIYFIQLFLADSANSQALVSGMVLLAAVVMMLAIRYFAGHEPVQDARMPPIPVRIATLVLVVILIVVGGSLILKNNILPWSMSVDANIVYGWVYLGAAIYFIYALLRPSWSLSRSQLLGFLVYDLVLLPAFLDWFDHVEPEKMPNHVVYTGVVMGSGLLAIYYLFISPDYRIIAPHTK